MNRSFQIFTLSCFFLQVLSEDNFYQPTIDDPEFQKKFRAQIIKRGNDHIYPQEGDTILFHYEGKNMNGQSYDSSFSRRHPYTFELGSLGVIRCWNEVIKRMVIGDRVKVVCPSRYAYGKHGLGSILPPNSDAELEFELLGINNHKMSEEYIDDL